MLVGVDVERGNEPDVAGGQLLRLTPSSPARARSALRYKILHTRTEAAQQRRRRRSLNVDAATSRAPAGEAAAAHGPPRRSVQLALAPARAHQLRPGARGADRVHRSHVWPTASSCASCWVSWVLRTRGAPPGRGTGQRELQGECLLSSSRSRRSGGWRLSAGLGHAVRLARPPCRLPGAASRGEVALQRAGRDATRRGPGPGGSLVVLFMARPLEAAQRRIDEPNEDAGRRVSVRRSPARSAGCSASRPRGFAEAPTCGTTQYIELISSSCKHTHWHHEYLAHGIGGGGLAGSAMLRPPLW